MHPVRGPYPMDDWPGADGIPGIGKVASCPYRYPTNRSIDHAYAAYPASQG